MPPIRNYYRQTSAIQAAVVCAALLGATTPALAQMATRRAASVVVSILPEAQSSSDLIRLSDVATIESRDEVLRQSLLGLDIAEFPAGLESLRLERERIALRVKLALSDRHRITVKGSSEVRISRHSEQVNDEIVIERIQRELAENWQVKPANVTVKLTQPLPAQFGQRTFAESDIDIIMPASARPGSLRIRLLLRENGRLAKADNVTVNASCFAKLVVANYDLERNRVISTGDIQLTRRSVRRPQSDELLVDFVGMTVRSTVRKGQIIESRFLNRVEPKSKDVVHPRDIVRLVARKGTLTVTVADAEVLTAGGVGDRVRVRNPRTKKVVAALVVDSGLVEIQLR